MLRFQSSEERYSIYHDPWGNEVYLQHGTARRLVRMEHVDLGAWWDDWRNTAEPVFDMWGARVHDFSDFIRWVEDRVIDPEFSTEITQCHDCRTPHWSEDVWSTAYEWEVCESCLDRYSSCDSCGERVSETTGVGGADLCSSCLEDYSWCDNCDEYYSEDDGHLHRHGQDGCCDSPQTTFAIPNGDGGLLANDETVSVSLPAGTISETGMGQIANRLRHHALYGVDGTMIEDLAERDKWFNLSYRLSEVGSEWQTKQGNFTKRLSRFAYNTFKLKLPEYLVSDVGNIAREHSMGSDFKIAVTRELNQGPSEFAHGGSCWWSDYAESRCALKTNGGLALRCFEEGAYGKHVNGRAWVMPVSVTENGALTPTFETERPHGLIVFNGYENLEGYAPARIMAHLYGWTYRRISFASSPMWINSESGYLVGPEDLVHNRDSVGWNLDEHSDLYQDEQYAKQAANQAADDNKEMAHV